jgi:hypothetical protein
VQLRAILLLELVDDVRLHPRRGAEGEADAQRDGEARDVDERERLGADLGELGTKASAISMLQAFVSHIRDSTDNQSSSRHMFLCAAIFEMTRYLERKSRSILQATANKLI